ncbi:proline-rich extensin-like protein EPR1 [Cheilinus undulatus]|uniref:proline-rich extensin-like protein EPR1 n=1 Tax=Cheilinus undulatus TaxID=241271 RepID=UPI001BD48C91|nr:proline-rich extensin-like protein EPR1 [Cheilinus undulatus]
MTRKRRNASVYLALVVIFTCYLSQTIDCYRLRKTERGEGRTDDNAPKSTAVQEGRIVFGRVFERGSGSEPQALNGTQKSSDVSSEDETAYQADFTGWYKGQMQDASSGGASWRRMSPSLQCGGDQMKFRVVGPGASQFAVEQGHAPPLPLSQVPPSCGYTMQKNPLSLVMSVPYDGCNMLQEGGNHVLPMRWQGIPVLLLCPGAGAAPNHPPSHPQVPLSQPANKNPYVSDPQVPQYPSHPHYPPQYPSMPEPTKAPTTKTNVKKPGMPQFPVYPPYLPHYPSFPYPFPMTTAKPTTSVPTTTAKPATSIHPPKFPYPYFPPYYPPFPWPYPGPKPTTAAPTTTTKQTTTQMTTTKPTTKPQPPRFPPYFPYPPYYPYPPFFPPLYPPYQPQPTLKPQTTTKPTTPPTTTTTITTTTTKKTDPPRPPPHFHPHVHYPPYPFMPFPPYPMPYPRRPV